MTLHSLGCYMMSDVYGDFFEIAFTNLQFNCAPKR